MLTELFGQRISRLRTSTAVRSIGETRSNGSERARRAIPHSLSRKWGRVIIACNPARFAGPRLKLKIERLNKC